MALPVLNINYSAFRSMFEREKLSGTNFNDWFRSLKLVLRVEKKLFVIKQPIPPAPPADFTTQVIAQWNVVYDAHNEVPCLVLGSGVEQFDLIQTFHAFKQEEGKSVSSYVLKIKGYVEQLERLVYVLPQDLSVGLIMNSLTSDFAGFVRNYNMHIMRKTISELHALFIKYEKGKGKGKGKGKYKHGYIPKPKNLKPPAKEHPTKDDACHHCKEGLRGERKLKQGALYLYVGNDVRAQVEDIESLHLHIHHNTVAYLKEGISATRILNMVPSKKVDKTPYELWYGKGHNLSYIKDTQRKRWVTISTSYLKKIVVARYAEFLEKNLISQEASGREVEGFEPPQEEVVLVRRSARIQRAPNRLCLNVEAEEHSLGDLNEPTNYKAEMLAAESDKWLDAMNA
nr:hypothetical protein [Tanacetum cinerariifolium]